MCELPVSQTNCTQKDEICDKIYWIDVFQARLGEVKSRIGVIHCSSTFTSNFHQLPGVLLRISLVTMSFDINQFHSHVHFVVVIS